MSNTVKKILAFSLCAALFCGGAVLYRRNVAHKKTVDTTFAMSTTITQTLYGKHAASAISAVNTAFRAFEERLSLFSPDSEIAAINAGSGSPVAVSAATYDLLQRSLALSATSKGAFDLTIAPLTLLWGVTTDHPRVPTQAEIDAVLPLIDDGAVTLGANNTVRLAPGQAIDLGGIAKGNACSLAKDIYEEYGITSAVLNIGGNVYIKGRNPNGNRFRVGFRDPSGGESSWIASVELEDEVLAVSGGYERYFEENGVRYCHIMNGKTGYPVNSDILSVGVITPDGTLADFMSTTLYVWGEAKTRDYMQQQDAVSVLLLTADNTLYVSKALESRFALTDEAAERYTVVFI
ncbi:MAG: FAD:protein FMN transferase [Pygmaiobacter sp.]